MKIPSATTRWLQDTAERTVRTFVQALLASLVATGWSLDAVKISVGAGLLAILTNIAGKQVGSGSTGSVLPGAVGGAVGSAVGAAVGTTVGDTVSGVGGAVGGVVSGAADLLGRSDEPPPTT